MRRTLITVLALLLAALVLPAQAAAPSGAPGPSYERLRLDVTGLADDTRTLSAGAPIPDMADGIGPGSDLLITIPNEGTFICTANFIWAQGSARFLGSAGHCFLPGDKSATHGPGKDYDASGVRTRVCVSGCAFGGLMSGRNAVTGTFVELGKVVYARQSGEGGDVGNDFGLVQIPAGLVKQVRPAMPVWGGPTKVGVLQSREVTCHYGNAAGLGEVYPTKGRLGLGLRSNIRFWSAAIPSFQGDSGSALNTCSADAADVRGVKAIGILTHIAFFEGIVGTTMSRAVELAAQAGLRISPVLAR